jgi:dethiobiotin synthetase/adenosylmethionine--8-amino-7-oxononanoate aminotransferase
LLLILLVQVKDKTIVPQFDACASWWTQGPDSNLQIELARDMGYAAARYGHVMFPENVHEPALRCAELLLGGVGKGMCCNFTMILHNYYH